MRQRKRVTEFEGKNTWMDQIKREWGPSQQEWYIRYDLFFLISLSLSSLFISFHPVTNFSLPTIQAAWHVYIAGEGKREKEEWERERDDFRVIIRIWVHSRISFLLTLIWSSSSFSLSLFLSLLSLSPLCLVVKLLVKSQCPWGPSHQQQEEGVLKERKLEKWGREEKEQI